MAAHASSTRRDPGRGALVAILAAFLVIQLALWLAHPGPVPSSADEDLPRYEAASNSWSAATTVGGFGPVGYPLTMFATRSAGLSTWPAARLLSLLAGAGILVLGFALVRRASDPFWAALSTLALGTHGYLHESSLLTGPAALAGCATLLVAWRTVRWAHEASALRAATIGLGLGALTLLRADALLPALVFALGIVLGTRVRGRWWVLLVLLAAYAPQMLLSLAQHGTPLYSTQAKNVWFGMHGGMHWEGAWNQVPDTVSWREVIGSDPLRFVSHWSGETVNGLRRLGWMLGAVVPVYLLRWAPSPWALVGAVVSSGALAVAVFALWRRRPRGASWSASRPLARVLVGSAALALVVWVTSVSAVFSVHRVLLPAWLLLHVGLFAWIGGRWPLEGPRARRFAVIGVLLWTVPSAVVHVGMLFDYARVRGFAVESSPPAPEAADRP